MENYIVNIFVFNCILRPLKELHSISQPQGLPFDSQCHNQCFNGGFILFEFYSKSMEAAYVSTGIQGRTALKEMSKISF